MKDVLVEAARLAGYTLAILAFVAPFAAAIVASVKYLPWPWAVLTCVAVAAVWFIAGGVYVVRPWER